MATFPGTVPALLNDFRTSNPTAPRLTWYGPDSERVELSGRVLENWVAKTANLLVDELDAEVGSVVAVDMPVHWRSLVWLLASWAVGGTAVTESCPHVKAGSGTVSRAEHANVVATTDPAAALEVCASTGRDPFVAAVALPALAMRWMGELPGNALDYSGAVRAHADVFFADDTPGGDAIAWDSPETTVAYAELLSIGGVGLPAGPERVLVQARDGWGAVVPQVLRAWAAGGSVVLLDASVAPSAHLRATENVTQG